MDEKLASHTELSTKELEIRELELALPEKTS